MPVAGGGVPAAKCRRVDPAGRGKGRQQYSHRVPPYAYCCCNHLLLLVQQCLHIQQDTCNVLHVMYHCCTHLQVQP